MKGFREIVKTFDDASMDMICILGYLFVSGPKPPEYQLRRKNLNPKIIAGLIVFGLIVATILIVSATIAFFLSPLLHRPQPWGK